MNNQIIIPHASQSSNSSDTTSPIEDARHYRGVTARRSNRTLDSYPSAQTLESISASRSASNPLQNGARVPSSTNATRMQKPSIKDLVAKFNQPTEQETLGSHSAPRNVRSTSEQGASYRSRTAAAHNSTAMSIENKAAGARAAVSGDYYAGDDTLPGSIAAGPEAAPLAPGSASLNNYSSYSTSVSEAHADLIDPPAPAYQYQSPRPRNSDVASRQSPRAAGRVDHDYPSSPATAHHFGDNLLTHHSPSNSQNRMNNAFNAQLNQSSPDPRANQISIPAADAFSFHESSTPTSSSPQMRGSAGYGNTTFTPRTPSGQALATPGRNTTLPTPLYSTRSYESPTPRKSSGSVQRMKAIIGTPPPAKSPPLRSSRPRQQIPGLSNNGLPEPGPDSHASPGIGPQISREATHIPINPTGPVHLSAIEQSQVPPQTRNISQFGSNMHNMIDKDLNEFSNQGSLFENGVNEPTDYHYEQGLESTDVPVATYTSFSSNNYKRFEVQPPRNPLGISLHDHRENRPSDPTTSDHDQFIFPANNSSTPSKGRELADVYGSADMRFHALRSEPASARNAAPSNISASTLRAVDSRVSSTTQNSGVRDGPFSDDMLSQTLRDPLAAITPQAENPPILTSSQRSDDGHRSHHELTNADHSAPLQDEEPWTFLGDDRDNSDYGVINRLLEQYYEEGEVSNEMVEVFQQHIIDTEPDLVFEPGEESLSIAKLALEELIKDHPRQFPDSVTAAKTSRASWHRAKDSISESLHEHKSLPAVPAAKGDAEKWKLYPAWHAHRRSVSTVSLHAKITPDPKRTVGTGNRKMQTAYFDQESEDDDGPTPPPKDHDYFTSPRSGPATPFKDDFVFPSTSQLATPSGLTASHVVAAEYGADHGPGPAIESPQLPEIRNTNGQLGLAIGENSNHVTHLSNASSQPSDRTAGRKSRSTSPPRVQPRVSQSRLQPVPVSTESTSQAAQLDPFVLPPQSSSQQIPPQQTSFQPVPSLPAPPQNSTVLHSTHVSDSTDSVATKELATTPSHFPQDTPATSASHNEYASQEPVSRHVSTDQNVASNPATIALSPQEQKRLTARRNIIKELVDTEFSYNQDMKVVEDIYMGTASAVKEFTPDDRRVLFGNSEQIVAFSESFLDALKQAASTVYVMPRSNRWRVKRHSNPPSENGQTDQSSVEDLTDDERDRKTFIGEAFGQHMARMEKVYGDYLRNHDYANQRLSKLQNVHQVSVWLNECHNYANDITSAWDLDSLLVKPVQRILKYPLLLKSLVEQTPEDHPDFTALEMAVKEMMNVSYRMNESKKRAELLDQVVNKQKKETDRTLGLSKAFGRRSEKLRQQVGLSDAVEDLEYKRISEKFGGNYFQLQVVFKDVEKYRMVTEKFMKVFTRLVESMEEMMDLAPSKRSDVETKWRKIAMKIREMNAIAFAEHEAHLRRYVIGPMQLLHGLYDNPHKLMAKRKKRLVDYAKYKAVRDRGDRPDKKTQEAGEQFIALNEALKDELPKLFSLTAKLVTTCLRNFVDVQVQWQRGWRKQMRYLLPADQAPKGWGEIVEAFQAEFAVAEAQVLSLGSCNGSLLAESSNFLSPTMSHTLDENSRPSTVASTSRSTLTPLGSNTPPQSSASHSVISTLNDSRGSERRPPSAPAQVQRQRASSGYNNRPHLSGSLSASASGRTPPSNFASGQFSQYPQFGPGNARTTSHSGPYNAYTPQRNSNPPVRPADIATIRPRSTGSPSFQRRPGSAYSNAPSTAGSMWTGSQASAYASPSQRNSNVFTSALPLSDSPDPTRPATPSHMQAQSGQREYPVLFLAASLFEFNIDRARKEAGYPYLTYVPGEIFDVIGEKGELWLAKNQDDPTNLVGWIWEKHFAKLVPEAIEE